MGEGSDEALGDMFYVSEFMAKTLYAIKPTFTLAEYAVSCADAWASGTYATTPAAEWESLFLTSADVLLSTSQLSPLQECGCAHKDLLRNRSVRTMTNGEFAQVTLSLVKARLCKPLRETCKEYFFLPGEEGFAGEREGPVDARDVAEKIQIVRKMIEDFALSYLTRPRVALRLEILRQKGAEELRVIEALLPPVGPRGVVFGSGPPSNTGLSHCLRDT